MAAEKSPAFQVYASDYLSDINTQLMTIEEEGCYWRLMLFCWRERSLPTEKETLTALCKGTVPSNRVLSCFTVQGTVLIHKRLEAERAKQEDWRKKCAKGGRNSAHKPKHKKDKTTEQGSSTNPPRIVEVNEQGSSTLQSSVFSLQSSTSDNINTQASPVRGTRKDEAYEIFVSEFQEHRQSAYLGSKADFIQIANLRKALKINSSIPECWLQSIHNYFDTPQGKYSLADLCTRFDVFKKGPLDRFGKPKEEANGKSKFDFEGEPGSTSDQRNSRGERLYIPKQ